MPGTRRNFECVRHRKDGSFALGSSSLYGNTWDGSVWFFKSWQCYKDCANLDLCSNNSVSGISDILWQDNTNLLVAMDSGDIEVWQCFSPGDSMECVSALSSGHDNMVLCLGVLYDEDSATILSGGADGRIVSWNADTSDIIHTYRDSSWVTSLTTHHSKPFLFYTSAKDKKLKQWDLRKNKVLMSKSIASVGAPVSLAWSPANSNHLAVGGESGVVLVCDVRMDCEPVTQYQHHNRTVHRVQFPAWSEHLVASASEDKLVHIHNITTDTPICTSEQHNDFVHGIDWHPTEHSLLSCGWDGKLLQHTLQEEELDMEVEAEPSHD